MTNDLELLREIFKDSRLHIGLGVVTQLGLANDGSILRVMVNLIPENREVVCEMTFADVSIVTFPEIEDMCVVLFADGHPDDAYVIGLVNTTDEKIPLFAQTGNTVVYSRPGKKLYLGSSSKVGIGRPNVEPAEPLVLGTTLINGLTALCNAFLNATQIGQGVLGPVFLDASVRAAMVSFMSTYLSTTSTNVVSQIAFTERGV